MASRTLTDLRTGAAYMSDMEDDGDFASTTERTKYLNEGIADLYDVRIDADNAKLFVSNGPQMPAQPPGTDAPYTWTLPNDFMRLVSLHIKVSGEQHPAHPADVTEYAELTQREPQATEARYYLREEFGTNTKELLIFPSGLSTVNIAYTYIKTPPVLSLGTDSFFGTTDELEYIETYAAIKMLAKEESDVTALEFRREQIKQRIRNATKDVDLGAPRTVRRVRRRLGYLRNERS